MKKVVLVISFLLAACSKSSPDRQYFCSTPLGETMLQSNKEMGVEVNLVYGRSITMVHWKGPKGETWIPLNDCVIVETK